MYGSLEITSTFAPVGWMILALAGSALAAIFVQRDRGPVEPAAVRSVEDEAELVRQAA
jgi:hypothetical protein